MEAYALTTVKFDKDEIFEANPYGIKGLFITNVYASFFLSFFPTQTEPKASLSFVRPVTKVYVFFCAFR